MRDQADRTLIEAKIVKLCQHPDIDRIRDMYVHHGHEAFGVGRRAFDLIALFKSAQLSFMLEFVRIAMPEVYQSL